MQAILTVRPARIELQPTAADARFMAIPTNISRPLTELVPRPMPTLHTNSLARACAVAGFLLATAVSAQTMPTAQEVFARSVQAIGGRDAILGVTSIRTTGKVEMLAMGMSANMESMAAPNRSFVRMTIPGIGDITSGYDGAVAWEVNPMKGPRIKTEKERAAAREDADFHGSKLFAAERYQTAETVGSADFGGQQCWHVKTLLKSGRLINEYFSVATGLKVGSQTTQDSPAGSVKVSTLDSDYKQFGALKLATRTEITTGAQKVVLTIVDVALGTVPRNAFELPEQVKALVKP